MAKELRYILLLDCYGDMLTDTQRDAMELYYCEDLSLAEISEPRGVTRQGIRGIIKQSEQKLDELEEKLGFVHKYEQINECLKKIRTATANIDNCDVLNELNRCLDEIDYII